MDRILPGMSVHKHCRDKISEALRSGQNLEAKRELLRPIPGQRFIWVKCLASRAAPIALIQEARRERAFVTGPPITRFPAHSAERFTLIGICQLLGVEVRTSLSMLTETLR